MSILLKKTLEDYFKNEEHINQKIFNELTLYIYSLSSEQNDLFMLARMFDDDILQQMIGYFDGDTIKLPTREEYKTNILTALCFWLKTFKGYSWTEIKEYLDIPENNKGLLSPISIGGKINRVKETLGKDLMDLLEKVEEKDFVEFYKKVKEDGR